MDKKQNILLVLDETERSMIIESLYNYIHYHFIYKVFENDNFYSENKLLKKLKSQEGGFRLITTEKNIFILCEALQWNAKFVVSAKERNDMDYIYTDYIDLSFDLENRNKNIYLFRDFDPKHYALKMQLKKFRKFDFTQNRILLIRFEKGEMEFVREFYREPNETDEEYVKRANNEVIKSNLECEENVKHNKRFLDLKYQAVFFEDVLNHKLKKDFSYHP